MRFKMDFSKLPKCGAAPKKNSSRTHPCRHVALKNGRCYYHQGRKNMHGKYAKSTRIEKHGHRVFIKEAREFFKSLEENIHDQKTT